MGIRQGVDALYEIEGKVSAVPGDFEEGQTSWRTTVDSARTCNSATCSGNWGGGGAFSTPEDPSQAEKSLIFSGQHCDLCSIFIFGLLPLAIHGYIY